MERRGDQTLCTICKTTLWRSTMDGAMCHKISVVFCPLDGNVYKLGKETQKGNYGGYLVIKHEIKDQTFYSLSENLSIAE